MIFNGFLFGLTASSTAVYGYALISHWAGGLQTSTLDEIGEYSGPSFHYPDLKSWFQGDRMGLETDEGQT